MLTEPPLTPVTIPVVEPIDAVVGLLLLHTPPLTLLVTVAVWPTHTLVAPPIDAIAFTVKPAVATQPVGVV